jgi:hypothetical protein
MNADKCTPMSADESNVNVRQGAIANKVDERSLVELSLHPAFFGVHRRAFIGVHRR